MSPPYRTGEVTQGAFGERISYHALMIAVGEFVDARGSSPFGRWFGGLDRHAAARVATALYRMEMGNLPNAKGVGGGVLEYRIDFGPGYRIYFGRDGEA